MLESLRLFANGWLAKIFLFIVLLCFTFVWGTPLYKSSINNEVLTAGKTSTSANEFIFQINKYLSNVSLAMGLQHNMSAKEAANNGSLTYFNNTLNFNTLLDALADKLKLNLSDKKVAQILAKDHFFASGKEFNVNFFKNYVHNLGIMQGDAIKVYHKEGKRKLLIDSIASEQKLPQVFFDNAQKYFNELYNIQYVTISQANLLPIKARDNEVLKNWYEAHKANYLTNEVRTVELFTLSKDNLIKKQNIKEEDIKNYYDKNIVKYTQEETRNYDLLAFNNINDAKKAQADINKAFAENKNIEHHNNVKQAKIPKEFKESIFSLTEQKYSDILKKDNKFYIAKLIKINSKTIKPLSDVHDTIKKTLAEKQASIFLNKASQEINDKLKTNTSFSDIAKLYDLTVEKHIIDKNGDIASNVKHDIKIDKTAWDKLLRAVFHAETGQKHIPVSIQDGGKTWYNLVNITPAKQKAFNEVKQSIIDNFMAKDKTIALDKRAEELKNELNNGLDIRQLADENNLNLQRIDAINRFKNNKIVTNILDEKIITDILSHKANENLVGNTNDPNSRTIIKVIKIFNDAKQNQPLNKLTIDQMNDELKRDLLFELELYVNSQTPLVINTGNINTILSRMR